MKYKIFFLTMIFVFASGCVAHFPKDSVLVVQRPPVRVVYTPPPIVHVHPRRPVVRTVHHHHRRPVIRSHRHVQRRVVRNRPHHRRHHRHHHHTRPRR
jgi:hypothetical protein